MATLGQFSSWSRKNPNPLTDKVLKRKKLKGQEVFAELNRVEREKRGTYFYAIAFFAPKKDGFQKTERDSEFFDSDDEAYKRFQSL